MTHWSTIEKMSLHSGTIPREQRVTLVRPGMSIDSVLRDKKPLDKGLS